VCCMSLNRILAFIKAYRTLPFRFGDTTKQIANVLSVYKSHKNEFSGKKMKEFRDKRRITWKKHSVLFS
jgi:hypothetical protein